MLTDEERQAVEKEVEDCECPQSASVEALQALQRIRGWISDEAIRDVAPFVGMSPEELDGVATFYSFVFRKPVGRHLIFLCDSLTCYIMGHENILEHINKRLGIGMGETTSDKRFTLLPVSCMGLCDHAPAMMIDEDLYSDLDSVKIDEILEKYP
ncbi:MAG TPA: NADH-quinone oxidoreductase subunit NuoE [Syntrophorhabdales bacterium]|nr:NADH-quinone oxidoreductase subunit NuoE [Syntrophorhabdales bacterium]